MKISVAMASYNGEKYIEEQIESICQQLSQEDELVISDDGSTDNTRNIVTRMQKKYSIVKLIPGPQMGIAANFSNAIANCTGNIIFLSDQDDIWVENKVKRVKAVFHNQKNIVLVLHRAVIYNGPTKSGILFSNYRAGILNNILKSSYWGCCMAFRREFINKYLPLDPNCIAHDQLIGLLAEKNKGTHFIDDILILHRVHGDNKTKKLNMLKKIAFRIKIAGDYVNAKKKSEIINK